MATDRKRKERSLDDAGQDTDDDLKETPPRPSSPITLNIGGTRFETTRTTLCTVERDWVLARCCANEALWSRHDSSSTGPPLCKKRKQPTAYFFDADPIVFAAILRSLRTHTPFVPPPDVPVDAVAHQLQFWCLPWFDLRTQLLTNTTRSLDEPHPTWDYCRQQLAYWFDRLVVTPVTMCGGEMTVPARYETMKDDKRTSPRLHCRPDPSNLLEYAKVHWPDNVYPTKCVGISEDPTQTVESWVCGQKWPIMDDDETDLPPPVLALEGNTIGASPRPGIHELLKYYGCSCQELLTLATAAKGDDQKQQEAHTASQAWWRRRLIQATTTLRLILHRYPRRKRMVDHLQAMLWNLTHDWSDPAFQNRMQRYCASRGIHMAVRHRHEPCHQGRYVQLPAWLILPVGNDDGKEDGDHDDLISIPMDVEFHMNSHCPSHDDSPRHFPSVTISFEPLVA